MSKRGALVIATVSLVLIISMIASSGAASAKATTVTVDIPRGSMRTWWFELSDVDVLRYNVAVLYGSQVDVLLATNVDPPFVFIVQGKQYWGVHDCEGQLGGFEGRLCLCVDNTDSIGERATGAVKVRVTYEHVAVELIFWTLFLVTAFVIIVAVIAYRRVKAWRDKNRKQAPIEVVVMDGSEDGTSIERSMKPDRFEARYCDACGRMMHPDPSTGEYRCDECGPSVGTREQGGELAVMGTPSAGSVGRYEPREETCGTCGTKLLYDRELGRLYCPSCLRSPPPAP